ncbi:hypothetical protein LWI29_031239 [Acer saccharum]|uniref:Uncharacterized protein n=1 Tax=Acer saccharum TaxID=4024 RepID=A0AA39S3M9_ACESA|nr:hypothetical protein LWI29_031239 [Acer saccharum]
MRLNSSVANRTSYRLESQLLPKENILCRAGISATTKWPYDDWNLSYYQIGVYYISPKLISKSSNLNYYQINLYLPEVEQ